MNARKPRTGTLHQRMVPRDVVRVLRAELDDDAAVAAWLSGGAR